MEQLQFRGVTMATVNFPLGAGTTSTFTKTGVNHYMINGKSYSKATLTNSATPTTDLNTGAAFLGVDTNKGSVFVWGFDSAGDMQAVQGSIEDLDVDGNLTLAPSLPGIPDDFCPTDYQIVKVDAAGSTWTFGTSNQSSVTGVTFIRQAVGTLPSTPPLS